MDQPAAKKQDKLITILKSLGAKDEGGDGDDGDSADGEQCDAEVWDKLTRSFHQAQSVLDQNRALIQQVNENHRSKIPDNLVKNVALIGQLNGNISKVLSIYSDLSIDFSNIVHQRRRRRATTVSTEDGKD
ncbi:protein EARLY FLOWERING 4 isoform X4 [Neltuma alba]|uniref:protein EARLY FLOWERING 4 isoform X4 n=1 Tax=Neltuma alba TaxID=207710 RepID=UPI0010A2EB94|nr:protein EARLY FLOWERING 4-like isoform X4 [Prosopis alba]